MSIGCRVAKFEKTVESAWMIIDMTNDTADGIHEFLLERREGGRSPESIDLYVQCFIASNDLPNNIRCIEQREIDRGRKRHCWNDARYVHA